MYNGDRQRKQVLIDYGFRLPSALDNRPLKFNEFEQRVGQAIYTSATPGPYEHEHAQQVAEQIIRPTGLLDPRIELRPSANQIDDLVAEAREAIDRGERVLVTTLTKRMAEELTQYLNELGLRVRYLHSDIDTLERVEITTALRRGDFDILVGINLLREGLDLPEVSVVAILDADKEGFLRSEVSLIQTAGRAARNLNGRVIFYADQRTESIDRSIEETTRRRRVQERYNRDHGIEPASILKEVHSPLVRMSNLDYLHKAGAEAAAAVEDLLREDAPEMPLERRIARLEKAMKRASRRLEFEQAAVLRDRLRELQELKVMG